MTARTLDGQALADRIRGEIAPQVAAFTARHHRPPGLAIVLVGENPASEVYVRNKLKAGRAVGFRADLERLPVDASLPDLLGLVERLNGSDQHDGILVQAPLPTGLGADAAIACLRCNRPGEGCRRLCARQCRTPRSGPPFARALYTTRGYRAPHARRHCHHRASSVCGRSKRDRGQADGIASAAA